MKIVADLHIHSHYSRATSKTLNFEHLYKWAQLKGVQVVGSGDLSHPGWLAEMHEKLEPAEEGLFRLKDEYAAAMDAEVPPACRNPVRFLLTGEISSIYKRHDRVRKVHNVIFAPTLEAVAKLQTELEQIGNIRSDGRPILGLDSRDLLEIVLEVDPQCYLIPAHIWTPWFSMLGSKSGFDTVEECFDDLTPHIFALETGLSSDPPMNWRVSNLDRYTLVSSSDAHSPPKLAREATLFDTELSYPALFEAMKTGDRDTFRGTIEFFPEEGKYHHDGHRKCNVSWEPKTTIEHDSICSVCGKPVTVGVLHRIEALADRDESGRPDGGHPFHSLIPLPEVISELVSVGVNSKRVQREFLRLLGELGPELSILQDMPLEEIAAVGGEQLAHGIARMRAGDVRPIAGYDGEYGVIKLFSHENDDPTVQQIGLFGDEPSEASAAERNAGNDAGSDETVGEPAKTEPLPAKQTSSAQTATVRETQSGYGGSTEMADDASPLLAGLNAEQRRAVRCIDRPLVIVAGPGTGKTRTLTHRIAYLLDQQKVMPENVLAITFTNKAASEMAERLADLVGEERAGRLTVKTFHAFGALLLREHGAAAGIDPTFVIASEDERRELFRRAFPEMAVREVNHCLDQISAAKNRLLSYGSPELIETPEVDEAFIEQFRQYEAALVSNNALDFDDLLLRSAQILNDATVRQLVQERYRWISVDEYQDVNLAQYRLLRLLTENGANLCVIGDPDQAIYGFRGADRRYFLRFHEDHPDAVTLHLSRNYRSTQMILEAATQVIARNPDREALAIWSDFVDQVKLDIHPAPTDKAEAEYVVHQIEQMIGGTSYFSIDSGRADGQEREHTFADFAVLYRTSAQLPALREALDRSGIPYQYAGQTSLYAQEDVRLILAYLWLLHSPLSAFHLGEVFNQDRAIFPPGGLEQMTAMARQQAVPAWVIASQFIMPEMMGYAERRQLVGRAKFMEVLSEAQLTASVVTLIDAINEHLTKNARGAASEDRADSIDQLRRRAAPLGDRLADFLESTVLQQETDAYDPRVDRVALMTLHAAKGLEFPVVFLVGCEEGLLPFQRQGEETDIDEERRLFYVGMTRAESKLVIAHAKRRFLFGQAMENPPSRFVGDIEQALTEIQTMAPRRAKPDRPDHVQLGLFE